MIGFAEMTDVGMTNSRMTNDEGTGKPRPSGFVIPSSFVIRHSSFRAAGAFAFTLVELLVVMVIILVLGGLTLGLVGFAQKKGKRSRAEAEIAALSAALENYKADNGVYPSHDDTNALLPNKMGDPTVEGYQKASLALYKLISGDADNSTDRSAETKAYFTFKPNQLSPAALNPKVIYIKDPFDNAYGYSTVKASTPSGTDGYNPTFDLWSTGGEKNPSTTPNQSAWIKNW